MKVAIVHDYLHQFGGGEKVVEKWLEMYPKADIFTALYIPSKFENHKVFDKAWKQGRVKTSFAQKILGNEKRIKYFKHFFWLYPLAMSFVKVENYDLVLISSVYCGKNVKLQNCGKIVHYCHSPTRFLHGLTTEVDHSKLPFFQRVIIPFFKFWLRWLDLRGVRNLNKKGAVWLANSMFIKSLIKKVYKTDSKVLYPPVEIDDFLKIRRKSKKKDYYLCHGRISHHKRLDLAIQACFKLGVRLKISGFASNDWEMSQLQQIVENLEKQNPQNAGLIEFLGKTGEEEYHNLLSECKAFLFPGEEDFGIAPVEVLAAGVPVIAYQSGGALDYIKNEVNGIFFEEQSVGGLVLGIQKFEKVPKWDTTKIRESSKQFSSEKFVGGVRLVVG